MAFDRHGNFLSAKSVGNLAQNHPCHGHHGHDVTNFGQIVKTKGKTTIYHNGFH
jgi:hypothetical protein